MSDYFIVTTSVLISASSPNHEQSLYFFIKKITETKPSTVRRELRRNVFPICFNLSQNPEIETVNVMREKAF